MTEARSGFTVVEDRTVWQGKRLLRVAEVTVESPEGERLEREVLHHPGAVAALPLHDDGTVTLVRQYRVSTDSDMWELPAGLRDVDGEPTAETARRELVEEAGLAAGELQHLLTFHNSPGCSDETVEVFLATGLQPVPHDRQGPEEQHMLVDRLPLATALAMVDDGRITDSKTVIGLLLVARRG
ncbi:MAG TPA: NUDIX hydrolase [Acidimicrobiales bacterium]|nr:NUDIX hydrolase [Acidimicrobiales bacterium]